MSRYLTHVKRLHEPEEPVDRFLSRAEGLGRKLGPVLIQLPPTRQGDPAALDRTLVRFPRDVEVVVEPRHPSWFTGETRAVLERHRAALCWADRKGRPLNPPWQTADFGYIRMHEGGATPWPRYGRAAIAKCLDLAGQFPPYVRLLQQRPRRRGGRGRHRPGRDGPPPRRRGQSEPSSSMRVDALRWA